MHILRKIMTTFTSKLLKKKNISLTFIFTLFVLLNSNLSYSKDSIKKGLMIATKLEQSKKGYIGESSDSELFIFNQKGNKKIRKLYVIRKEIENDGDKSLMNFISPKNLKGTKFLTYSHLKNDDEQWLYLPSMKKLKKINSKNKGSSFMGSEFSYEDLSGGSLEKYTYKYLKDETLPDGRSVWVIESYPIGTTSSYSKIKTWILMKPIIPMKVEYYNKEKKLFKVANFKGYKKLTVKKLVFWRPQSMVMNNVINKKKSVFKWKNLKIGQIFKDRDFSSRNLRD